MKSNRPLRIILIITAVVIFLPHLDSCGKMALAVASA